MLAASMLGMTSRLALPSSVLLGMSWARALPSRATSPCISPSTSSHGADRKSTRLNSSHLVISYAVFCLKKKKEKSNELVIASLQLPHHEQEILVSALIV